MTSFQLPGERTELQAHIPALVLTGYAGAQALHQLSPQHGWEGRKRSKKRWCEVMLRHTSQRCACNNVHVIGGRREEWDSDKRAEEKGEQRKGHDAGDA